MGQGLPAERAQEHRDQGRRQGGGLSLLLLTFILLAALTVAGALGVVFSWNIVYSALFLLFSLLMAAGLYVILLAPFLALVQVLLYGGAIIVLILFALMLTRARDAPLKLDSSQKPLALAAAGAILAVLLGVVVGTTWPRAADQPQVTSFTGLGDTLFSQWAVPSEIASLVLLVALIGAIVIARTGEER